MKMPAFVDIHLTPPPSLPIQLFKSTYISDVSYNFLPLFSDMSDSKFRHLLILQLLTSISPLSLQTSRFLCGHLRIRCWSPNPQVLSQDDHVVHWPFSSSAETGATNVSLSSLTNTLVSQ